MAKEKAKTELYFEKNNKGSVILAFPFLSPIAVDLHHISLFTPLGLLNHEIYIFLYIQLFE